MVAGLMLLISTDLVVTVSRSSMLGPLSTPTRSASMTKERKQVSRVDVSCNNFSIGSQ